MVRAAVLLVSLAASLTVAAPASARYFSIPAAPAPGPARYDRVWIETHGPARARTVLVLVPGTSGGVGSVAPLAADLARRVRGLQVWAVDRREQAFEDQRGFRGRDPLAYYLDGRYKRVTARDAPFAADWGLAVAVRDLRRVVARAREGGRRRVLLGGHSRGASTAAAYAAWDFGGRGGHRDLSGLVLIDGGLLGALGGDPDRQLPLGQVRARLARIRAGDVFDAPLGAGLPPETGGIFAQLAGVAARTRPDAVSRLAELPLLPAEYRPAVPVTNAAFLGTLFDADYSTPARRALRTHSGRLAASGSPRKWVSGELTPVARLAAALGRVGPNATEWYFPSRLILDVTAANPMRRDAASRLLGLRLWHTRDIRVPLFAWQTDLTGGAVLEGARRLQRRSRVPRWAFFGDTAQSHLDPVFAAPSRNALLRRLAPWLAAEVRRR